VQLRGHSEEKKGRAAFIESIEMRCDQIMLFSADAVMLSIYVSM
jgi:hypothetical protein